MAISAIPLPLLLGDPVDQASGRRFLGQTCRNPGLPERLRCRPGGLPKHIVTNVRVTSRLADGAVAQRLRNHKKLKIGIGQGGSEVVPKVIHPHI